MYCPFCQAEDTKVIDSRLVADGSQIRRRREFVPQGLCRGFLSLVFLLGFPDYTIFITKIYAGGNGRGW